MKYSMRHTPRHDEFPRARRICGWAALATAFALAVSACGNDASTTTRAAPPRQKAVPALAQAQLVAGFPKDSGVAQVALYGTTAWMLTGHAGKSDRWNSPSPRTGSHALKVCEAPLNPARSKYVRHVAGLTLYTSGTTMSICRA